MLRRASLCTSTLRWFTTPPGRSSTPDKRIRKFRQVEDPAIADLSLTAFRDHIVAQVVSVGVCPVVVEVPERPLEVPELPKNPTQLMYLRAKKHRSYWVCLRV